MLVNLMEKEVIYTIDKMIDRDNNLKPNYVVTDKGEVYTKINNMNYQFNTDIVAEITKAIQMVRDKPQH